MTWWTQVRNSQGSVTLVACATSVCSCAPCCKAHLLHQPTHPPSIAAVRPGEEVVLTGIYQHNFEATQNARHGFPVYSTHIEANHVQKKGDQYSAAKLTDDDKAEIRALARDPRIGE